MTNITELTAKLKAAAQKATPGRMGDRIDGSGSIKYQCVGYDGSVVLQVDHKNMEYGFIGDNADADEEFFRACVPDAILAMIEALEAAEKRVAELEAREVKLSKLSVDEVMHLSGFSREYAEGWCAGNDNARHEIQVAGIRLGGLR